MPRTMADSENLYKVAREFFDYLVGTTAIIEISELPMGSWKVLIINTGDELIGEKIRLRKLERPRLSFDSTDGGTEFQYLDENMLKGENCITGAVEYFYDLQAQQLMLEQARREMKTLVKMLR